MRRKVKFTVRFELIVVVERETDPEELGPDNAIDGEYGGWWWKVDNGGLCLQSDDFYETEKVAFEVAKEQIQEYIDDHVRF